MVKTKWFIYTLIVGLVPLIARLCIYLSLNNKQLSILFDPIDFVILGLVINISNINELEGNIYVDKIWKTKTIGISIIFIIIYAIFFSISIIYTINSSIFNKTVILIASIILSSSSVVFGFSVFDRLNNIEGV